MTSEVLKHSILYEINLVNAIDSGGFEAGLDQAGFVDKLKLVGTGTLKGDKVEDLRLQLKKALISGKFSDWEISAMSKYTFEINSFLIEDEFYRGITLVDYFLRKKYPKGKALPKEGFEDFMKFVFGSDYYPR